MSTSDSHPPSISRPPPPPSSVFIEPSTSQIDSQDMGKSKQSSPVYRLLVTAGTSYSPSTHQTLQINGPAAYHISTPSLSFILHVKIRDYRGLPSSSPAMPPSYFSHPDHRSDQYSISFSFVPHVDIPGPDLVFGNDFDRPIRDRLPPGFSAALKVVRWWIDPGLEGDPYADKPYLYGPALSSWNVLHVGDKCVRGEIPKEVRNGAHEQVVIEGGTGSGDETRKSLGVPDEAAARKKYFLTAANLKNFTFEKGRLYQSDFGNPYLNFNDFSLQLPYWGSLNVIKYVDSKTHELRYTLKNKTTGEVYCAVLFTLLFGEELAKAEEEDRKKGNVTLQQGAREATNGDQSANLMAGVKENTDDESPSPDDVD